MRARSDGTAPTTDTNCGAGQAVFRRARRASRYAAHWLSSTASGSSLSFIASAARYPSAASSALRRQSRLAKPSRGGLMTMSAAVMEARVARLHHDVDRLAHQPQHRTTDRARVSHVPDVDGDDDVGAHAAHDVGRHVVHRAAVDEHLAVALHRRKDPGQRHRGAHGRGERAVVQDDLLCRDEIDRDRAEGRGQLVEARDAAVRACDAREQEVHLLAVVERNGQGEAAA